MNTMPAPLFWVRNMIRNIKSMDIDDLARVEQEVRAQARFGSLRSAPLKALERRLDELSMQSEREQGR